MLFGTRRSLLSGTPSGWTPAIPTTDGRVLPHTWLVPGVANFQDAAKTTPAGVGDVVGAIMNRGSSIYDIVQATAANKPTLQQVTINAVISYVWRLDGTSDVLQGAFGGGAISQPFTTFVVGDSVSTPSASSYITDGLGALRMIIGKGIVNWAIYAGTFLESSIAEDANPHIFTGLFNGASSSIWISGGTPTNGDAGAQGTNGLTVGANRGLGSEFWAGDIGQILIYPGNLSTADKNQVGKYLERATGITWTTI